MLRKGCLPKQKSSMVLTASEIVLSFAECGHLTSRSFGWVLHACIMSIRAGDWWLNPQAAGRLIIPSGLHQRTPLVWSHIPIEKKLVY